MDMQGQGEIARLYKDQADIKAQINWKDAESVAIGQANIKNNQALIDLAQGRLTVDTSIAQLQHEQSQRDTAQISAEEKFNAVEESVFSTEEEKGRNKIAKMAQENTFLEGNIELLKIQLALLSADPRRQGEADQVSGAIAQAEAKLAANKRISDEQAKQLTLGGQLELQFKHLNEQTTFSAKNVATALANSWGTALDGISKGLTDVIFQAKTMKEAFQDIARTIVTELVQSFIKMAVTYVAQKAFMFMMDTVFSGSRMAMAATEGAAITTAMAPAAAVSSVATFGGSAVGGLLMAGIALAGIVALCAGLKGFNEGGLIPGSPSSTDNRIARVATGEYIVRAGSVSHYGSAIFEALNNRALPRMSLDNLHLPSPSSGIAFATGGLVGPGVGGDGGAALQRGADTNVHVAVLNTRQDMADFMRKEGKKHVVDIVSGSAWKLGIS